ncbi:uncharacterized protein LOC117767770 [Tachysurus ichikawai]
MDQEGSGRPGRLNSKVGLCSKYIKYRSGCSNKNADAISRQYMSGSSLTEHVLPGTSVPALLQQALGPDHVVALTQVMVKSFSFHSPFQFRTIQKTDPLLKEVVRFWQKQIPPIADYLWCFCATGDSQLNWMVCRTDVSCTRMGERCVFNFFCRYF